MNKLGNVSPSESKGRSLEFSILELGGVWRKSPYYAVKLKKLTSKAVVIGSVQEHKFLAVTIFLMSSTVHCSAVGLLPLFISFCNAFSPEDKK